MRYYSTHKRFHLFYCIAAIVIVCHFVCNLMAFVCQEIKGLLTYLLTYSFPLCPFSVFEGPLGGRCEVSGHSESKITLHVV